MKVYFLKLTQDDFLVDGNVWTSDSIDLYDNDSYRNFSSTKSDYGLNSLGNRTWTGLQQTGLSTDSGVIVGSRFLDTTGKICLFDWEFNPFNLSGNAQIHAKLDAFTIDDELADFPNEWSSKFTVLEGESIAIIGAYRYAKFNLTLETDQDLSSLEFEFIVRVHIEIPVMDPLYDRTKEVLKKFPEWMSLREVDILDVATPELATPTSLGAQLLNAVAGEWLTDINLELNYQRMQQFIATADETQTAWVYRADGMPKKFISIKGDGVELTRTAWVGEFYELTEDEDGFYWDAVNQVAFTKKLYDQLIVDGIVLTQNLQQVWNWFDEHGAMVDIFRHHGEDNDTFRKRILDVYINKPGVGLDAFKLALRRELNLWLAFSGATPDSSALGATPEILEMEDIEIASDFMGEDGLPTQKFIDLVLDLAERYPTTWGFFKWNRARWDVGGVENKGYGTLPYVYDATPLEDINTQSGVGDGNDLLVYKPDVLTGPREFEAQLKVRGRHRTQRDEYPPLTFSVELSGAADREIFDNPELDVWVTAAIDVGTEIYYLSKEIHVKSDVDVDTPVPTENGWISFEYYNEGISQEDIWYDSSGNEHSGQEATPFTILADDIVTVSAIWGRFDPDTQTFTDFPADNSADLWFGDDPDTTLAANNDEDTLDFTHPATPADPPVIVIQSNETSSSIERWESESQEVTLTINGSQPDNGVLNVTLPSPTVLWDNYLESPPNKTYIVQFATLDFTGSNYVAEGTMPNGDKVNYPIDIIYVNGDNTWVDGVLEFDADTTPELEFSSGTNSSPDYPISSDVWVLFESTQLIPIEGVVDENGPWRNGIPQTPGNLNFALQQVDVDRADFGVPDTDSYIVTWMGVDILDNSRVIAWLDSNTVNPANDIDTSLVYPDNAIIELYDEDTMLYSYSPFILRARLRPGIDPEWYPQVHSGWFYERNKEYYLYANPVDEDLAATPSHVLNDVPRQGAPIILRTDEATPEEYRQVAFMDDATPVLQLENKEIVYGSGSNNLYISFENVFNVSVIDLGTGLSFPSAISSTNNVITTSSATSRTTTYEVTYTLDKSFIADHDFISAGDNKTKITIAQSDSFSTPYKITYEGSTYDPATPVDLPLNSFYTTIDEGFIFVSHEEYDPVVVEVRLSPSKLIADGEDYLMLSARVLDIHGNPKPNQTFNLSTTFGTFENNLTTYTMLTDRDGFATVLLVADNTTATNTGYVYVDGPNEVDATVSYSIDQVKPKPYRLVALPSADQIPADGESQIVVYGRVEDPDHAPVPYAAISWKKGRSICEMFSSDYAGQVIANDQGIFSIGPLTSATPDEPGYWFVGAESWDQGASPSGDVATPDFGGYDSPDFGPIGDVVFWLEFPDSRFGVNDANELPKQAVQMQTNPWDTVYYSNQNAFPVTYDDATPLDSATPVTVTCETPLWYAIDKYTQYQLGFLGTGFYSVDFDPEVHPDYKDI